MSSQYRYNADLFVNLIIQQPVVFFFFSLFMEVNIEKLY